MLTFLGHIGSRCFFIMRIQQSIQNFGQDFQIACLVLFFAKAHWSICYLRTPTFKSLTLEYGLFADYFNSEKVTINFSLGLRWSEANLGAGNISFVCVRNEAVIVQPKIEPSFPNFTNSAKQTWRDPNLWRGACKRNNQRFDLQLRN